MKRLINSRKFKMGLHLASMYIFSIPITTHILKLALGEKFCINGYCFSNTESFVLIFLILSIVSTNIYSIVIDKGHKISFLITGGFLSTVTMIQLVVIMFGVEMMVFGHQWQYQISIIEISITGLFSLALLFTAAYLKEDIKPNIGEPPKNADSPEDLFGVIRFVKLIDSLDRKIAFFLGIISSIIIAIPICAIFYLVAFILLENTGFPSDKIRLIGWIGIVGMQGSIISMLFNLRRFENRISQGDNLSLFLNALVRPFIGLSFAHLSFFMLESGLLQDVDLNNTKKLEDGVLFYSFNYHVSVAFIAGFTERIAQVIERDKTSQVNTPIPKN